MSDRLSEQPDDAPREDERPAYGENKEREVLESSVLFQGQKELVIEHNGERYRLRITRKNKLILQK